MKLRLSFLLIAMAVTAVRAADTIPLAGEWRFSLTGTNDLTGHIKLPGTIDDAGLGPKNTKPPTLEGPYRLYDYAGPAWYQRDIEIPAAWTGKRVTLFLERCRWVTTVWLDDKQIGSQDSLIAPHVYDFGTGVAPGKHRLTICVDNTVKINLGKFVSALFGGTWGNMNGIVGRIELNATPPVWIDDVQVYFDATNKCVRGKARIVNSTSKASQGKIKWAVNGLEFEGWTGYQCAAGASSDQPFMTTFDGKLWDEFSPNLFNISVRIESSDGMTDTRKFRTGMREFAAKGTQFTMNGRPVFLRGTLECSIWPLTGYPPTDIALWQKIYRTMKSYGFNHIRFHSWCPPEAAFAAADTEGIMIQVEGPMANVDAGKDPARDAFIEAEFKRIVDTYGNHPSFCTMTLGNEYGGDESLRNRWLEMLIARDPRHLYASASGFQKASKRQWTELIDGRGVHGPGTQNDLSKVVASDGRPIIGHEIGQWMYWPDSREIKKWTGVMALKNFEMVRDDLAKKNLLDLEPQFVQASGKFATLLYKEEIEVLLRTPGYAGFSLLDLHDYPTQGTALIGPLDAFWDSKGFITPEAYRRFCGPTVPLLRMAKRTFAADEPFAATVDVAHYGATDIAKAKTVWTIKDEQGHEIAAGTLPEQNVATGKLTSLGAINASLAKASAPGKLTVTVSVGDFTNDWEIWVYPANVAAQPPADVTICEKWETAKSALAEGKKVVFFAYSANTPQSMLGKFLPVFWSPVWFPSQKPNTMGLLCDPKHPLFAQFPTEMHSNWQWYELMQRSRLFILDETPANYRPTFQVIDNFARNHKLGVVFEGLVGKGQLLVCGLDLPYQTKEPAARQLLASLYQYVGSPVFKPTQEFNGELLEKLFVSKYASKLQELHASIRTDSQHHDHVAANAIDGDPNTMWHTQWEEPAPNFPHHLDIELPKPVKLVGLTCLARQDGLRNGRIKDYAVCISADGKNWGAPVAKGSFKNTDGLQSIKFAKPVETRFLRFVALDGQDSSKPFASLAEIDFVTGDTWPVTPVEETVILTPPPPVSPRINGPKVYGARPGHPFLYRIPCTGARPIQFGADNLPASLKLDPATGFITGTTPERGDYKVTLRAQNKHGVSERIFKIIAGDKLALTPPMGWNHWYAHYNRITDDMMREAADIMVASGMADAGYQYVNVDDCWMNAPGMSKYQTDPKRVGPVRDANGKIMPNACFPDMKALADYIHSKGLKAGIYTSPGVSTCAGFGGALGHEAQDAKQFADWGFDFLKYDWCSYGRVAGKKPDLAAMQKPFRLMGDLLKQQNRDIVFNLCQYGMGDVWKWGAEVGGHSWRTGGDLGFELHRIFDIALKNCSLREFNKPGAFNDPDYIQIGWIGSQRGGGFEQPHPPELTPEEQRSFMSLWCLMASPLFYSGDMTKLDAYTLSILCNPEVIEVDQDQLGECARVVGTPGKTFVLAKKMEDGSLAVGLCNRDKTAQTVGVGWAELDLTGKQRVRDLWRQKDVGVFAEKYETTVPARGVVLIRIWKEKAQ